MNITFWILMILMLLVAIGLLVYPILKVRKSSTLAYKDSNLKIHDEKIKELDLDLKEGRIDQGFYKAARDELGRELLIDVPAESKETAALHYTATAKRQPVFALIIAIFIPLSALLLYLDLGMHAASEKSFAASQKQQSSAQQPSVEDMASQLEEKIKKEGGTVQEWIMLGRTHKYLGANEQAANAFAVALEKDSNNAQVMLERAEVLALSNNRQFNDESRALVLKAYVLEPDNPNALWFVGVAEYQSANYHQAIDHLLRLLPFTRGNNDEVTKSVITMVEKSRQALIAAGEEMPELAELLGVEVKPEAAVAKKPPSTTVKTVTTNQVVNQGVSQAENSITSLTIAVDVSEKVKQKFAASDVVFVYAKAKQGPRMPLAAQRLTLGSLPAMVILDDSMAMVEGMNLTAFEQLLVSARVTKTGSAIAQSGDYIGQISVEGKLKKTTLKIVIDTIVP